MISPENQRTLLKRRLNFLFGWLVLPIYVAAIIWLMVELPSWPVAAVTIGFALLLLYSVAVLFVYGGLSLFRSRGDLEPTEWMRRGGLMASPEANARPDEARIRSALSMLPAEFPAQARDAVEAYLAMADDDEKQLSRDHLIREFYERASSAKVDFTNRRAYNALRLALSPWAESNLEE